MEHKVFSVRILCSGKPKEVLLMYLVTVGRPCVYGLMIGGQAGVEQVLQMTLADLYTTLGMAGYQNLEEIQGKRDSVVMKLDF